MEGVGMFHIDQSIMIRSLWSKNIVMWTRKKWWAMSFERSDDLDERIRSKRWWNIVRDHNILIIPCNGRILRDLVRVHWNALIEREEQRCATAARGGFGKLFCEVNQVDEIDKYGCSREKSPAGLRPGTKPRAKMRQQEGWTSLCCWRPWQTCWGC